MKLTDKTNEMKAKDLVNNGTLTIEELMCFCEGFDGWENTQLALNEATVFQKAILDFDTNEDCTNEEMLNANIIDEI